MPKSLLTPLERLLSKTRERQPGKCWVWTAYCQKQGYGYFRLAGKQWLAHRASWHLHKGAIPDGKDVLHDCDNPPCINPSHLYLGTDIDNVADKMRRGRHRTKANPGEAAGMAKLTNDQVLQIRELWARRTESQKRIAARFGVSQSLVCMIGRRRIWTHL